MGRGENLWLSIFQTLVLHLICKATHKMKPGSIPQMRKPRSERLSDAPRAEVASLPGSQKTRLPAGSAYLRPFPQVRWLESRRDGGGAGETDYGVLMLFQEAFSSGSITGPSLPALLPCKAHIPSLRAASGAPGGRHSSWKRQPRTLPMKESLGKASAYPFRTPFKITPMLSCSPSLPEFATSLSL